MSQYLDVHHGDLSGTTDSALQGQWAPDSGRTSPTAASPARWPCTRTFTPARWAVHEGRGENRDSTRTLPGDPAALGRPRSITLDKSRKESQASEEGAFWVKCSKSKVESRPPVTLKSKVVAFTSPVTS